MTGLSGILDAPNCQALGLAVIHFLWQGVLIGALSALCLRAMQSRSSEARYVLAGGAMLTALATFLLTLTHLLSGEGTVGIASAIGLVDVSFSSAPAVPGGFDFTEIAAACWFMGVLWMTGRYSLQQLAVGRLRRHLVSEPGEHWVQVFESLKMQLRVSRTVKLLRSGLAETVMVIGWLRPVVLIPVSAFTALTLEQLRAVLVHELAHIRRFDHWVNLVQRIVEIILFFHPVTWWLSRQLSLEREYCCDDMAVRMTGSSRDLAEALFHLESSRAAFVSAGLAANGGKLSDRIRRIVGSDVRTTHHPKRKGNIMNKTAGIVGVATLLLAGVCMVNAEDQAADREKTQDASLTVEEYRRAERGIRQAVEKGEVSRDDAEKRLGRMRLMIRDERPEGDRAGISVEEYRHAEREIRQAVEKGEVSREHAEIRLGEMRKHIAE